MAKPFAHKAAAMVAVATALLSCGGSDSPQGGQCQPCRKDAPRCDGELSCRGFYNSSTILELCATRQTSSCPTPD